MTVDYIVSSLPPLAFDGAGAMDDAAFGSLCNGVDFSKVAAKWLDLETQIRNAICEERAKAQGKDAAKWKRAAEGCSLYWRNRAAAAMAERDTAKREAAVDRVLWDAVEDLVPAASPLGVEALFAYSVRLGIARKRAKISAQEGGKVFDAITAAGKIDL
ncbi:MAG: DUF2764 family protein [Kiritimatiellae bacterium]|nr:DUF2764 family protein [Kiritimatiellia bacterium]